MIIIGVDFHPEFQQIALPPKRDRILAGLRNCFNQA